MKLQTFIRPRGDGSVSTVGQDGVKYVFKAEEGFDGLVCDVDHEDTVASLLASGNFEPASADDFERAIELSASVDPEGSDESSGPDDGTFDGSDDEIVNGGLPVEANTPPVARKTTTAKTAKKK